MNEQRQFIAQNSKILITEQQQQPHEIHERERKNKFGKQKQWKE